VGVLPLTGAGPSRAGGGLSYLLRATFDADDQGYANGQVLDTVAEGIQDGTLTLRVNDGVLTLVSNQCYFEAQSSVAWGDKGWHSQAIPRALGRTLLCKFYAWYDFWSYVPLIFLDAPGCNPTVGGVSGGIACFATQSLQIYRPTGLSSVAVGVWLQHTWYEGAVMLGGYNSDGVAWRAGELAADYLYGIAFFIKGGAFANWTLLWRESVNNTTPVYAVFAHYKPWGYLDDFRVPNKDLSAVLQPTCLSTFTAANGTSLDAITPEVGGAWTEQAGNWDIQSNRANSDGAGIATVNAGVADALVDCVVNIAAGGVSAGTILRYTDSTHYWYVEINDTTNTIRLYEQNAGLTQRASAAIAIAVSTDYKVRAIAYGQTIDIFLDGGNKASYASAALNETVGVHGLNAVTAGDRFDNFAVFNRTSAVYTSTLDSV